MLSTTFLGHHGWLCQSKTACFIVDPLLCEEFGHAQALEYRVYPPRLWTPENFPKLDAIVLTHEHDDHFDIPSLAKLDRAIPVYLSSRSSSAARQILSIMGFTVKPLEPGQSVRFGDLELTAFAGDHVNLNCGDEWDTLPFFVRHTGGSGNFFSLVDITMTEQHIDWARAKDARPVLVSWTNNALDWSHMTDYLDGRAEATQDCFMKMGVGHKLISTRWGAPAAMAMCAGGFSFVGEKEWLNQRVFCVDTEAVCEMMAKLYRSEKFVATRPGQTFWMEGHRLKKILDAAPFLQSAPVESWPSRRNDEIASTSDYSPATGRRALADGDVERIRRGLTTLAGALVGGAVFKSLHSLLASEAGGRAPTFALVLRNGDDRLLFEYVPSACAFVEAPAADPRAAYLAGLECWASDFLAVLDGELGPIALTYGRAHLWNALPERFRFDLFGDLYRVSHPLRRPAEYLRLYQRLWSQCSSVTPTLGG